MRDAEIQKKLNLDLMILFSAKFKVQKHGILKNGKQIRFNNRTKKNFITKNDLVLALENYLMIKLRQLKIIHKIDSPIDCDLNASFTFYFPKSVYFTKKNERSKKIPDLDNLLCLPLDCLKKSNIIIDDNIVCGFNGTSRKPIEGNEYILEIELSGYNG